MMLDAKTDFSCNDDEYKCFELIVGHAKDNELIYVPADEFEQEMEQEGIKPDQFDNVLSKMEGLLVAKRENLGGGERYICINSEIVQRVKTNMKEIECPSCKKPGIHIIKKRKCHFCNKEYDME